MKATAQQQNSLLELGRIDLQIKQNGRKIAEINSATELENIRAIQIDNSERLLTARNELDALALELNRAQVDYQLVASRFERDELRLKGSNNQKEAQAIQSELQALAKRKSELEDVELQLLDKKQELEQSLQTIELERIDLQSRLRKVEEEFRVELATLKSSRALLEQARDRERNFIGAELCAHYDRLAAKMIAVGKLEGLVCDACGLTLSGDFIDAIKNTPADEIAHCGECGAILVR